MQWGLGPHSLRVTPPKAFGRKWHARMSTMAFYSIKDPSRLHSLIDAILLIDSSDATLHEVLSKIVVTASNLVGARYGALGIVGPDGDSLISFITHGISDDERLNIGEEPHGHGLLGETISLAQPIRVSDISLHPRSSGFPEHHPPMTHFLGVPVRTGDGHVYGNLYLTDPLSNEPFSEDDEELIDAFGRAAGLVIDQITIRSQLRELTLAQERERVARELNESVLEGLVSTEFSIERALALSTSKEENERLEAALRDLRGTIEKIRAAVFDVEQELLDTGTLQASNLLGQDQIDRARLRIERQAQEELRIESLSGQERRILELLSEGLTNREIAAVMFLAEKTVKNYVSNVLAKLGFARRTEAALFAVRQLHRD